jgi:hypothetical protein
MVALATDEARAKVAQVHQWIRDVVELDDAPGGLGQCSDSALIAADTTVIGPGGATYTSSLLSCAANFFAMDRLEYATAHPEDFQNDPQCNLIDICPRNLQQIAEDRGVQAWNNLAEKYQQRIN